jgi:hypothetical protein
MSPVLGADKTAKLIQQVNALEDVRNVRELLPLLTI